MGDGGQLCLRDQISVLLEATHGWKCALVPSRITNARSQPTCRFRARGVVVEKCLFATLKLSALCPITRGLCRKCNGTHHAPRAESPPRTAAPPWNVGGLSTGFADGDFAGSETCVKTCESGREPAETVRARATGKEVRGSGEVAQNQSAGGRYDHEVQFEGS